MLLIRAKYEKQLLADDENTIKDYVDFLEKQYNRADKKK